MISYNTEQHRQTHTNANERKFKTFQASLEVQWRTYQLVSQQFLWLCCAAQEWNERVQYFLASSKARLQSAHFSPS